MWYEKFRRRYVINLPARTDRRDRVAAELGKLGVPFEFFDACRGKDNPYAEWFFRKILNQTATVSPGILGCHLSHAMIWIQTMLDDRIGEDDFVLIMEDDLAWDSECTNKQIETLLLRVPEDANMIKFSICDWSEKIETLEQRGQVATVADGIYLHTGLLGGLLMYGVRKSVLPSLIQFNHPGNFDNTCLPKSYLLIPKAKGIFNAGSNNYHHGVCYQGDLVSDITG